MSKDFKQREAKKPKKDAKKTISLNTQPPPPPVEVIKRGKKEKIDF